MKNEEKMKVAKENCTVKFRFENITDEKINLCLLPGIAIHEKELEQWGFKQDRIAYQDDEKIKISSYDGWTWQNFISLLERNTFFMKTLVIQNLTDKQALFDHTLTIGQTLPAVQPTLTKIDLQDFINPMAYDRTKITIKWNEPWPLDATTYMALPIPARGVFIITLNFYK